MEIGTIVMLVGREDDMPLCGSIGEIVGPMVDGDYDVEFPGQPCQVGETSWCVPPVWLVRICGPGIKHAMSIYVSQPIGVMQ